MPGSALVAVLTLLAPAGTDSVYGAVRDAITGAPLAGVWVESEGGGPATITSSTGAYSLSTPASGIQALGFRRSGYDTLRLSVTVPAGTSMHLDVELDPVPQPLPPLEVAQSGAARGPPVTGTDSFEIGLRSFSPGTLRSDPLTLTDDPLQAIGTLPAAAGQSGFPSTLHVHGGAGDQNLLLVDGLPVYGAMHIGGAASLLNPDAVERVDLHTAVPPASYGGRLSSTLEVQLRPSGDGALHLSGAWDPTAVRQLIEGSFARGAGSLLLSGRQSYRGVFSQDGDRWSSNEFNDVLTRAVLTLGSDEIRVYLLQTNDRLSFPAGLGQQARNRFSWSSTTGGAVWIHPGPGRSSLTTRIWSASSEAGVNWLSSATADQAISGLSDLGLSSELLLAGRSSRQRLGLSLQRTDAAYQVFSTTAASFRLHSIPTLVSAHAEEQRSLGPVYLSAGLRANWVTAAKLALEPRLSLRYRLSPTFTLSAGAARLHQYLQSMRNEESLIDHAFGAELPVAVGGTGLRPARSDQLTGELETRLGGGVTLDLTGYTRRFQNLLAPALLSPAPFAPGLPPVVTGHAEGIELEARYRGEVWEGRLNLGMAATERDRGESEFVPTALRGRWAAAGIARRLDDLTLLRLATIVTDGVPTSVLQSGVEWQSPGGLAGSGEISGSPQILGPLNGVRLPFYFRTDLGLARQWPVSLSGRRGLLITSITVTNLFDRENTLGWVQDGGAERALLFPRRTLLAQLSWRF